LQINTDNNWDADRKNTLTPWRQTFLLYAVLVLSGIGYLAHTNLTRHNLVQTWPEVQAKVIWVGRACELFVSTSTRDSRFLDVVECKGVAAWRKKNIFERPGSSGPKIRSHSVRYARVEFIYANTLRHWWVLQSEVSRAKPVAGDVVTMRFQPTYPRELDREYALAEYWKSLSVSLGGLVFLICLWRSRPTDENQQLAAEVI
jgi:hypothetical protein